MQLGTRWSAGGDIPARVPAVLHEAIRAVEAQGATGSWTLTFLEGRPLAELDAGFEVALHADGSVTTERF